VEVVDELRKMMDDFDDNYTAIVKEGAQPYWHARLA
jgi:hypothetical protein